jgi:hypothetical protein
MRNLLLFFVVCAGVLSAQQVSFVRQTNVEIRQSDVRLWRASVTALAVANALDVHSSWGKHEMNATLAGPNGSFGRDGALIKAGIQGGLLGFEYLITHGRPSGKLYRALSFINFGASAAIGSVAAHNYTVPRIGR